MKKILLIALMLTNIAFVKAQNYDTLYIQNVSQQAAFHYCANEYDGVVVMGEPNWNCEWNINFGGHFYANSIVLLNSEYYYYITYHGSTGRQFNVFFHPPLETSPFADPFVWKRQGESVTLSAVEDYDYEWLWSNGSTNYEIEVTESGTYSVTITSIYGCGSATYSVQVRDNVELYRATVDLATGLNKVTWLTTPEQAEYVSQVKVERDGMTVATVPYEDGQFIDNIGSENAARNYRLTAIGTDGTECPIPSYQKGTLHVDYSPNANNPNKLNMAWTPPFIEEGAPIAVSYFQICKYDPATGEVTVIDQIGANSTIASYDENLFDGGYATVAALFSEGRAYDDMSFSNLTEDLLATSEKQQNQTKIYPNPSNGAFTVEGTGNLRITNLLGQEILTKEIAGQTTIELPTGVYFLRLNGVVRKVVVE